MEFVARKQCLVVAALGLLTLGAAPRVGCGGAPPCTKAPAKKIADGVEYYDCSQSDLKVHAVTIDRGLKNHEIRLLSSISPNDATKWNLRWVQSFAEDANALVAVNGQLWDGDEGNGDNQTGQPLITTFEFGQRKTENRTTNPDGTPMKEVYMGFKKGGDGIEPMLMAQDELDKHPEYQYQLYGSNTPVMTNGECNSWDMESHWSVIGYSDKKVVFLSTDDAKYKIQDFCDALKYLGVTDAILQDGGPSVSMYVKGEGLVNPLHGLYHWKYGRARHVAFAIGLVPLQ